MEDNNLGINNPQSVVVELDYEGNNTKTINTEDISSTPPESNYDEQEIKDESLKNEEELSPQEEQPKKRSKRWEKERRDREEKYLLSQALAEEKRRNIELQKYLERSVDNNTYSQYEQAVQKLQAAEIAHASALESNDALAASKASTELIKANLAVERLANSKIYSDAESEQTSNDINPTAYAAGRALNDWLSDNPEFDEDSEYFNPNLASKIGPLVSKLDNKLKRRGQEHLISSPVYFDIIDSVVSQVKSGKVYNRPPTGAVSTKNYNQSYNSMPQRRTLTTAQKSVAAACNMSEQQYINWLNKYDKEKLQRESSRGAYE